MRRSDDARTRAAAMMMREEFEPLVALALASNDPTIYAMAIQACKRRSPAAGTGQACQLLSPDQLAQLDPDNLMTWLDVAAAALARGDAGSVAEAMHRASQSHVVRERTDEFTALALSALPPEVSDAERLHVLVAVVGMQAGLTQSGYQTVGRYCTVEATRDANRRQTCAAIAERMVTQGRTLLQWAIGRRIGERVGWPADRVDLIGAKVEAFKQAFVDRWEHAPGGPFSCESQRCFESWFRDVSLAGEVSVSEQRFAQHLPSEAILLEQYRTTQRRRADEAQAATASAAAASVASAPR
jgi:hypothetical protein